MNIEQLITDELHELGAAIHPPPAPDPALLAREAEQARVRSLVRAGAGMLLAAALVLGIVALGNHLGDPKAAPGPSRQPTALPTGAAPSIPWVRAGILYLDGQPEGNGWAEVFTQGGSSVATRTGGDALVTPIYLFHGSENVRTVVNASTQGAVLSPNGRVAAWVQRGQNGSKGTWQVVAYSFTTGLELGRTTADPHVLGHIGAEDEGWETLSRVDDDGTVWWGGALAIHQWKPGSAPVQIGRNNYQDPLAGFPSDVSVQVGPGEIWGAWTSDEKGKQDPQLDDGTTWYADGITVQKPHQPRTRFTIALPVDSDARGLEWESASTVLVTVFDDPDGNTWHYVRCTITTRRCEVARTTTP